MLTLAFGTMFLFVGFKMPVVSHLAFLLRGVSFGALVTLFQTAVTRQVKTGKDVATSLQSSTFNFGIVMGSTIGGTILEFISLPYYLCNNRLSCYSYHLKYIFKENILVEDDEDNQFESSIDFKGETKAL